MDSDRPEPGERENTGDFTGDPTNKSVATGNSR